ncbi:MAG: aminotransferase class I/II-fold pyridoxal phosphate-dependent enzyme [Planctomycetota bacterium]
MDPDRFEVKLSERMGRLPPYLFGKINALKLARRRAGEDVIDLGMGNPSDPPAAPVIEKLVEAARDPRNHRYSQSSGIVNLRREIAKRYRKTWGVKLNAEREVIACIGSKEGFSHMCLALLGPGDTALVCDPAFPIHIYGPMIAGANVIRVPLVSDQDEFIRRLVDVATHLLPRPKVLILNFPHNPTAMTVDRSFFEEIARFARMYGVMVMHDFAYGETCFGDYRAPSFLEIDGAKDVACEFYTMSKPYNMAGWRVGFCVGNADMIAALAKIKGYYDYGIFQPIQIAAIVAMRECDDAVLEQAKAYEKRRDALCAGLARIGWHAPVPRASMFVWARYPEKFDRVGSVDLALRLLDRAGVAVAPGRAFGDYGEGYMRLALVENEQRLTQAVREIQRAVRRDDFLSGEAFHGEAV